MQIKPTSHFLKHYPEMMKRFGPLVETLRFEVKHSYFKGLSQITNNRQNICQTLAKRHQYMLYLHYSKQDLLEYKHIVGSKITESPLEGLDYEKKALLLENTNFQDTDIVSQMLSVLYEGEHYDIGSVHVCDFVQDEFVFGVIGSILLLNSTIYFVCEVYNTSQFLFDYNAYEILSTGNLCLYQIDQLIDFQPLSKYKIDGILLVQLKHFIPTPVDA